VSARRFWTLPCGLLLALGLAACGNKQAHPSVADNEGFYVDAGPITYQVELSRELNPFNIEDHGYLSGLPASATPPKPDEEWFAIFLWAKNQTGSNQTTASSFDLVDTQGNKYTPIAINSAVNPYAWTALTLKPSATEPAPNSTASEGPTQGSELLFKLNTSAYANRPVSLEILGQSQQVLATVSIDL
jgi:hypothetical protein